MGRTKQMARKSTGGKLTTRAAQKTTNNNHTKNIGSNLVITTHDSLYDESIEKLKKCNAENPSLLDIKTKEHLLQFIKFVEKSLESIK